MYTHADPFDLHELDSELLACVLLRSLQGASHRLRKGFFNLRVPVRPVVTGPCREIALFELWTGDERSRQRVVNFAFVCIGIGRAEDWLLLALDLLRVAIEDVHIGSRFNSRLSITSASLLKLLQLLDPRLVEEALERFAVVVEVYLFISGFPSDLAHQVVDVQIL